MASEAFIYWFDALLMFVTVVLFNIQHPSMIVSGHGPISEDIDNHTECYHLSSEESGRGSASRRYQDSSR